MRHRDTNEEYTAILELDKKLTEHNIPHELTPLWDGWIIRYFDQEGDQLGDVVEHMGSYGQEQNLMEAMGFNLPDVKGFLDVDQAFELFKVIHYGPNVLKCPFCGGEVLIKVCDDEGNIHEEPGYEQDPWSGVGYQLWHAVGENTPRPCPIARYEGEAEIGIHIYDSRKEAAEAWNRRTV